MPESSSRSSADKSFREAGTPGQFRGQDEPLPSGGMATAITDIVDTDFLGGDPLHTLDPDQVPEQTYKKKLGWQFWVPLGWFTLILLLAISANWLQSAGIIRNPEQLVAKKNLPPFSSYRGQFFLLGTDTLGRDMLSRIIYGAQISLEVGFGSIFLGLAIGAPVGIVAGYFKNQWRGAVDIGLMSVMYIFLAFPPLLLSILVVTFTAERFSNKTAVIVLAIGIVAIPPIALLVRAATLSFTQREFVLAARTIGASHARVIVKEVFPNVILPIVSFAIIGVAIAITAEGALAFLGLSVPPPTPTWGGMINEGRTAIINGEYWPSLTPCIVMFLTILSLNLTGDRVREYFDVKEGAL